MTRRPTSLILDFGGVLTTDFWEALRGFCRREKLPANSLIDLVTKDRDVAALLHAVERGSVGQEEFAERLAERLLVPVGGLLERIAADLRPDEQMLATVAELRAGGVHVGVLSNSWGSDLFDPYAAWRLEERADVVVISDQVGMRKPELGMFELVLEKLGVPAVDCVFVDDVPAYLKPARDLGMTVLHHRDSDTTVRELRRLFVAYLPQRACQPDQSIRPKPTRAP